MEKKKYDVAIVGGGASGLAAANIIKIHSPKTSVLIIEKNESIGKKLRATGNGRCNISNTHAEGFDIINSFFRYIGIVTKEKENGLIYPYSESAADVVELFNERIRNFGIDVELETTVSKIEKDDDFTIYATKQASKEVIFTAEKLVLALGGKAAPVYGTTGDGYALARNFGHSIVTPIPVLTAVECAGYEESLAGIRANARIILYKDVNQKFDESSKIFEEDGEIQFTKYGLSGIAVFNMSRYMRFDKSAGEDLDQFMIELNLFTEKNIWEYIMERKHRNFEDENILRTILKENLANYVMKIGIESIHNLRFRPIGIRGWNDAQVTAGGVSLDEIDRSTYESLKCKNLYVTGELLDYDGPCGGYNLSNAWLSGIKAGVAIVSENK